MHLPRLGGRIVPDLRLITAGTESGGHGGEVFALAFTPDGNYVLSGGWDGHLRLWDTASQAQVTALRVSAKALSACAVSPDGKHWLAGTMEGMMYCWDSTTHRQQYMSLAHTRPISTILFSLDGQNLLTASWDRRVVVWDRHRCGESRALTGHEDIVAGCCYTPDGSQVLSWSHDRTARLWDVATGQALATLEGAADRLTAGAVAPDGLWAVTGARDHVLTLWDLRTAERAQSVSLQGEVRACLFLPDAASLVTVEHQGRVVLCSVPDLQEQQEVLTQRRVQCAGLSPDGSRIALGCDDGSICCLAVEGLDQAALLVTPIQQAPPREGRWQRLFGGRRRAPAYACTCPTCRQTFDLPDGVLGQAASCPRCCQPLRLRPVARPA
jgi:WD40 repeat protein